MKPYKVLLVKAWRENILGEEQLYFTAEPAAFCADGVLYTPGWQTQHDAGLSEDLSDLIVEATRNYNYKEWSHYPPEFRRLHSVTLARAETMVRVLRRVNKGMRELSERIGRPQSPAQQAAYMATVLGVKGDYPFARYVKEMRPDGTHYHHMNADSLGEWLHKQEAEYLEKYAVAT